MNSEWTGCRGCTEAHAQGLFRAAQFVEDYASTRLVTSTSYEVPLPSDDIVAALRVVAARIRELA